jgi:hypothetical protein
MSITRDDPAPSPPTQAQTANNSVDQLYVALNQQDPTLQLIKLGCGGGSFDCEGWRRPTSLFPLGAPAGWGRRSASIFHGHLDELDPSYDPEQSGVGSFPFA